MPIERIIGNLQHRDVSKFQVDYVNLEWYNTRKKIGRWRTENGKEVAVRFSDLPPIGLCQDDILLEDGNSIIAINILPTDVLCIHANTPTEIAKICYEIGNRHAALFFGDNAFEFRTPFEKPIKFLLDKLQIKNFVLNSKLDSSKRISVSTVHVEPSFVVKESPDLKIVVGSKG